MGKIADFYAEFSIKDLLSGKLKDLIARIGEMRLLTLGEITSLGVLGDMFKNVGVHAMDISASYVAMNKELGLNTDLLQRWQNVARASNVPAEAVATSFANIQRTLAGFRQGQINTGFLQGAAFLNI